MEWVRINKIRVLGSVFTIVISILSYLAMDISGFIQKLIIFFTGNTSDTAILMQILDISLKIIIAIIILFIWIIVLLIGYVRYNLYTSRFDPQSIVNCIKKEKNIKSLIIFGYSLSFAEDIRYDLDKKKNQNLKVKIYIPHEEFIKQYLREQKPINSRIEEIKARLCEWKKLKESGSINDLSIREYSQLPMGYGVIVDNKYCYISCYPWEIESNLATLKKKPKNERKMILVKEKNKDLWDIINANIKSMELNSSEYVKSIA